MPAQKTLGDILLFIISAVAGSDRTGYYIINYTDEAIVTTNDFNDKDL